MEISAFISILELFGVFKIKGTIANPLFTCLTLYVSGVLIQNPFNHFSHYIKKTDKKNTNKELLIIKEKYKELAGKQND